MSWSVGVTSKLSDEAAVEIERQFAGMTYPCPEPEETIKQGVRDLLAVALKGNIQTHTVNVSAWGSQSTWTDGTEGAPTCVSNTLNISIT
jgi:hypothetical protein